MIDRYTRPEMAALWTKQKKFETWLEVELNATYKYSEDLTFTAGYAHLFAGDGLTEGAFIANNQPKTALPILRKAAHWLDDYFYYRQRKSI